MLKILETPGYICNRLRLLSQDRFDNVELSVRVENRRCSRCFEPQLNVSGKHLNFCLSSMPVCLASTTNTARQVGFVCQCSKTSFCFPQVKLTVCQAHTFVAAKLTSCLTSKISRLLNNACSFGRGFRRTVRIAF